jgi:hypothetical protein
MTKRKITLISAAFVFVLACNLSQTAAPTPNAPSGDTIATSVAQTLTANGQIAPNTNPTENLAPTQPLPPTQVPPPTASPTIALSPTPSVPMVSVSEDTNCRTGPGKVYDYLGALMTGEKAEVVGKNTPSNYWIIKNPDRNGTCWLWGRYATVVGNTANLQEYAAPPTPTPSIPSAPSNFTLLQKDNIISVPPQCAGDFTITWKDTSENEGGFNLYKDGVQIASYESSAGTSQLTVSVRISTQDSVPFELGITAFNGTGESARAVISAVCP